jgi:UDP-glucose 4-epimerase
VAFHRGNAADVELVRGALRRHGIGLVMHFAGSVSPPESLERPLDYYRNNTATSEALATACAEAGVRRFIFSSSAAVYGRGTPTPFREDGVTAPLTPYGASKLATETMLRDLSASCPGFDAVSLRYFNVAGADPAARAGRRGRAGIGLIDRAVEVALGRCTALDIWGDDYDTRDGAGERDYIHVSDVADVHLAAMRYLERGGRGVVLNCASGRGHTVLEVLAALEAIVGRQIPRRRGPRRLGDVASAVANVERLAAILGWRPRFDDLRLILRSALAWQGWTEA